VPKCPGNGQMNGCHEDHNQIGSHQEFVLARELGSVAACKVLPPMESLVAATSPPLLLYPKPIQVYFRRRQGARRVEETTLGSSPSQPPASAIDVSTSRVFEFLSNITKEVNDVLENPAPNPHRKKKLPGGGWLLLGVAGVLLASGSSVTNAYLLSRKARRPL
jgi:hypothetical protein